MVEGILVVNLDPPYVGFVVQQQNKQAGENKRLHGALKNCTLNELRQMLLELGAISPQQQWPDDCPVHFPGSYSEAALEKIGLESPGNRI
jgi:hypothetical protein